MKDKSEQWMLEGKCLSAEGENIVQNLVLNVRTERNMQFDV